MSVSVRRGKREITATKSGSGVGAYAPGVRKLELDLPRRPKRGKVRVITAFADANGNVGSVKKRVRLPRAKRRR